MDSNNIFGVSYSLHRCSELGLNKKRVLRAALKELGFKRVRLMSYWNIHEPKRGKYDFKELDWQLDMASQYGAQVSLCIGKRQPRWPECHMPDWAKKLPKEEWYGALYTYIRVVVNRYKNHPALHSWQLENEALLKKFGHCEDQDYSRKRLQKEYEIIRRLDAKHPIIMTLSDSWGLPLKKPTPDLYAMSLYRITINKRGNYVHSTRPAAIYKIRCHVIGLLKHRPVFIHELQAEPWLSTAITNIAVEQQIKWMDENQIIQNISYGLKTGMRPIDLWGLEWWYYLKVRHKQPAIWKAIKEAISIT